MKKSSFLVFIFAFIPGAAQMYLGYMKRGTSLMLAFALNIAIAAFFNLPFLTILLPIIWFYAFFDAFNLNGLTYEQRLYTEDKFLFHLDSALEKDWIRLMKQRHLLFGGILLAVGVFMIYNSLLRHFLWELSDRFPFLGRLLDSLPTLVIAVVIIYLGIRLLVGGKQKAAPPEDGFVEYGGGAKKDE